MAKVIDGELSGKMGDKIYSTYLGRPYVRKRPESVANPRTEAQQAHRTALVTVARLSSDLKNAHRIGLHHHAQRKKLSTDSDFRKLNLTACVGTAIAYREVVVSKGSSVNIVNFTSVVLDERNVLHVTFESNLTDTNKGDKLCLFVYCPELRICQPMNVVLRSTGEVSDHLLDEFKDHELHLYGFLQGKNLFTSNTIYSAIEKKLTFLPQNN